MDWTGRQVLVTGAGGFIGSRLVEQLVERGARVRAFVRYTSRGDRGSLAELPSSMKTRVEVIAGDLRDETAVREAAAGVDVLFHLAALIAIPYSYQHPREVIETNVIGTLNVLMAVREQHVTRLIHTSTSEVYGTARYVPIDEAHPLQGQSPYSASKIGADKLVESFHCAFGVPVVTVRPFNTYGPGQSMRAVIPTIIAQALTSDTVRLGSVEPVRDFTYVNDTVAGFLAAAELEREIVGGVFNLGTGQGMTIGEVVEHVGACLGKPLRVVREPQRIRPVASEVGRLIANASAARQALAWAPTVSFRDGLERTSAWIQSHLERYQPMVYHR